MRRPARLKLAALVSLAALAALVFGVRATSRRYVFPRREVPRTGAPADLAARDLTTAEGRRVHTLEIPAPPGGPTVVYFHNNRETVEACAPFARELARRGLGVVLVEYRGYGAAEGEPSEDAIYGDADIALAALAARGVGPSRVVLWGTSLGTGVAAEMARRGRGAALVLVTPYTSIPDLVTAAVPIAPARALLPDHFDTLGKAKGIQVPTLVVHGDADEVIPYAMGEELARTIDGARLLRVPGARHGDVLWRSPESLFAEVLALARRAVAG